MTVPERQIIELLQQIRDELKQLNASAPLLDHDLISVTEEYGSSVDEHDEYVGPLPAELNQQAVGALT